MADQSTPQAAALPNVPDQWPGAFGAYKFSKKAVLVNVWPLIGVYVLFGVIDSVLQSISHNYGGIIGGLIGVLGTTAGVLLFLAGVRGQKLSFGDAISKALPYWLKMFLLGIIVGIMLAVSIILLFIPFLFVLPRVSLAHFFLVDQDMGPMEAVSASWAATKGHAMNVWGIIGVTVLMALLMITIIGIPFSIYFLIMYSGAYVVLYEYLNKKAPVAAKPKAKAPAAAAA